MSSIGLVIGGRKKFPNGIFSVVFLLSLVATSASMATPVCGNGISEAPEQCDDGNKQSGDGCSSSCAIESNCGNRVAEPGEQCDQGLPVNGTTCQSCNEVVPALCGNGVVEPSEDCDPVSNPNTCNLDCTISTCGDGKIGPGEQCDGHGQSATCNSNCKFSNCLDGILNTKTGEECDAGMETPTCNINCKVARCGDNYTNTLAGEQCDPPGALTNGDTCSPACKVILAPTSAPSAGGGGMDSGTIIGIAVGVASLLLAAIPICLGYRKYAKHHNMWPYKVAAVAAATPGATQAAANLAANAVVNGGNGP